MEKFCQSEKVYELVTIEEEIECLPSKKVCKEFIKEKCIEIPPQKPKIEELAKIIIKPIVTSHKIIKTKEGFKVIVQGKIIEKVFYVADKPEQSVHAAKFSFPFCNFIKLPHKYKNVKDVKVNIEDVVIQLTEKRRICQCILICICAIPDKEYCNSDCDC